MKKRILRIVITIILGAVAFFIAKSYKLKGQKQKIASEIQQLPTVSFYSLKDTSSLISIKSKNQKVLFYFHPTCEHCIYEVKEILQNQQKFKNTDLFFISDARYLELINFEWKVDLFKCNDIQLLWDKNYNFEKVFGKNTYPTIFIYDNKNELLKKYVGETKVSAITKHLQ